MTSNLNIPHMRFFNWHLPIYLTEVFSMSFSCIDFHPFDHLVTVCVDKGDFNLFRCYAESDFSLERLFHLPAQETQHQAVRFIRGGTTIVLGSFDHSITFIDVETGIHVSHIRNVLENQIRSMTTLTTDSLFATGDVEGYMKVWDSRQPSCCNVFQYEENITDIACAPDSVTLFSTSTDGTLSGCDIRSNQIVLRRSHIPEEGLNCVSVIKNGEKLVCGTYRGFLSYTSDHLQNTSDRFTGICTEGIQHILKLDEDRVIVADDDGVISLVSVLPNRVIGTIGVHRETSSSSCSLEGMALSYDKKFIASTGGEYGVVKIWDVEEVDTDFF